MKDQTTEYPRGECISQIYNPYNIAKNVDESQMRGKGTQKKSLKKAQKGTVYQIQAEGCTKGLGFLWTRRMCNARLRWRLDAYEQCVHWYWGLCPQSSRRCAIMFHFQRYTLPH